MSRTVSFLNFFFLISILDFFCYLFIYVIFVVVADLDNLVFSFIISNEQYLEVEIIEI